MPDPATGWPGLRDAIAEAGEFVSCAMTVLKAAADDAPRIQQQDLTRRLQSSLGDLMGALDAMVESCPDIDPHEVARRRARRLLAGRGE